MPKAALQALKLPSTLAYEHGFIRSVCFHHPSSPARSDCSAVLRGSPKELLAAFRASDPGSMRSLAI